MSGTEMKMGSIAIALIAEYGEFWPSAISLIGSSWTNENPASDIQRPSRGRSPISPMPQLPPDGIEKSGTSRPACRPWKKSRGIETILYQPGAAAEDAGLGQQTHHEKRFVREIEEVPRMHHDSVAVEQIQHERLLRTRCRHADDGGPACPGRQDLRPGGTPDRRAQDRVVGAQAVEDLPADGRPFFEQRRRCNLDRSGHRKIRVTDQLEAIDRLADEIVGPVECDPPELHLRQADALRKPAKPADQARRARQRACLDQLVAWRAEGIVAEDVVNDQGGAAARAAGHQLMRVRIIQD